MMRSSGNSAATISGRMWKADHTTMFVTRPHTRDVKLIELRSDTFTLPTPAMRRAMADAEVGDDQYGEDPTVNRLEKRAAEVVGKEAAVYVASGMLGNLCGVLSQTERGDEVILGDLAHIYQNEMGASFVLGSIQPRLVPIAPAFPLSRASRALSVRPACIRARRSCASRTRTTTAAARSSPWKKRNRSPTSPVAAGCACISTVRGSSTPRWRSVSTRASSAPRSTRCSSASRRDSPRLSA